MFESYLYPYVLRIMPGALLGMICLAVLGRKAAGLRIVLYIMLFILIRDAMTPLELWKFEAAEVFWIRFTAPGSFLVFMGMMSAGAVILMGIYDPEVRGFSPWFIGSKGVAAAEGLLGALLAAGPLLFLYTFVPLGTRGGAVEGALLPGIFAAALLGNFYEEVLFRGYFQGYLEKRHSLGRYRAGLLSGLFFGFGHSFLALTVTGTGWPLLAFAVYEGILCGIVRARRGVFAAVLTHGFAIFLLAAGLW